MRSIGSSVLTALILALAVALPTAAGSQRPMRGSFMLTVVPVDQRCGPNDLTLGFTGIGHATHLGSITGGASNCTEPSLGTDAVAIWDGTATFVAADGSVLTTSYAGMQEAPVAGIASVVSNHTVVSGTGRFAGASGSWQLSGEVDFVTGTSGGTISGWVSY
ncbi:MAG: hypothetical protein ACRDHD_08385 [Candidatus Limnocylindria bacterium]